MHKHIVKYIYLFKSVLIMRKTFEREIGRNCEMWGCYVATIMA